MHPAYSPESRDMLTDLGELDLLGQLIDQKRKVHCIVVGQLKIACYVIDVIYLGENS